MGGLASFIPWLQGCQHVEKVSGPQSKFPVAHSPTIATIRFVPEIKNFNFLVDFSLRLFQPQLQPQPANCLPHLPLRRPPRLKHLREELSLACCFLGLPVQAPHCSPLPLPVQGSAPQPVHTVLRSP